MDWHDRGDCQETTMVIRHAIEQAALKAAAASGAVPMTLTSAATSYITPPNSEERQQPAGTRAASLESDSASETEEDEVAAECTGSRQQHTMQQLRLQSLLLHRLSLQIYSTTHTRLDASHGQGTLRKLFQGRLVLPWDRIRLKL